MENTYGIGITNRYALFLDEEADPLDILKQSDQEKLAAKTKKIEAATKPAAKAAPVKPGNTKNESDKENNAKNNRFEGKRVLDARKTTDGPREERNNQRNRDGEVRRGDDDGERRGGGRGRGRGGDRGGRGGERGGRGGPGGRGGKREFDRKSGDSRTGIKPEEKRGGSGKGNWGNFEDDVKAEGDEANTTATEEPTQEGEAAENKDEAVEDKAPVDEEPKTMTLDEWKAQQQKKEAPKFNVRKPGEGQQADPKWKKATSYKKQNEEESEEEEEEEVVYLQRANRQKKVNINFTFADESRGGGGGRGRGRGGRGRGGDRRDGGERRDRPERGEGGERRERPDRGDREEGGPPRRGGPRGGGRGGYDGGERGGPRGGGRGGDRGGRGGRKEFSLDQDAFPTLG